MLKSFFQHHNVKASVLWHLVFCWSFPGGSVVKNYLPIWETQDTYVWSPHLEDPLEEEMVTHSSILAWKILWPEEPGRLYSMRSQSQTWLSNWAHTQTTLTPNSQHSYMTTGKTTASLYGHLLVMWWLCVLKCCLGLSQLSFQGQVSFNFMTAVSICSDSGDQEKKISLLLLFPCLELKGRDAMILVFWMLSFKPYFSFSSFNFIKRALVLYFLLFCH